MIFRPLPFRGNNTHKAETEARRASNQMWRHKSHTSKKGWFPNLIYLTFLFSLNTFGILKSHEVSIWNRLFSFSLSFFLQLSFFTEMKIFHIYSFVERVNFMSCDVIESHMIYTHDLWSTFTFYSYRLEQKKMIERSFRILLLLHFLIYFATGKNLQMYVWQDWSKMIQKNISELINYIELNRLWHNLSLQVNTFTDP